jgi:hypothetical protein
MVRLREPAVSEAAERLRQISADIWGSEKRRIGARVVHTVPNGLQYFLARGHLVKTQTSLLVTLRRLASREARLPSHH